MNPSKTTFEKKISYSHISAQFKNIKDALHEVVLKINSHKFFLNIKTWLKKIESLEVIAVKWCIELGVKVIRLLKKIVTTLYFEY